MAYMSTKAFNNYSLHTFPGTLLPGACMCCHNQCSFLSQYVTS
jgi:hypothetical protein